MMPGSGDDALKTTGGQVDSIVLALIDASFDKNEIVTSAVCKSLFSIGKHQPNLVLSSCFSYLQCHTKIPLTHKILVLKVIDQVSNEALNLVKKSVALDVIKLAVEEMISTKEVIPEWQGVASAILVSLGRRYCNEVMEHLLVKFLPDVLPHFYVMQTIANLTSANVFGMIPFLKAVLATTLPLLCLVKQENMKWIFAYAFRKFCDAIVEYTANLDKAPDPSITKEIFMNEMCSAYDVLYNNWLQSREPKVRSEVVGALGHMTHLLSKEKFEELFPKFVPTILAMYKRHQDCQSISQGLCLVLDAAVENKISALDTQMDSILNVLFPQVCTVPDYSQPSGVRNHNEVLRCFAVLTSLYADKLIHFLLQRLEYNNESARIGSLTVLKHLINSCDILLAKKIPFIIVGLKGVLDSGNKVKKVIAQVIVALAHHGHLENEGGLSLIWFLMEQCALPDELDSKRPNDPDYVSNEALRGMCENVIHLLTTTVEKVQNVLWPSMLDCLLSEDLTSAAGTICKSLAYLAERKREELGADFSVDYGSLITVTSPQILLSRLLVLLGYPHESRNRGLHILHLLKAISPIINRSLVALWDQKIPKLIQLLENTDILDWDQEMWFKEMTEFAYLSLSEIDREEWTLKLGKALQNHFILYSNSPRDKNALLRILGVVIKKVVNKNFINQTLDSIFAHVNHSSYIERVGCAIAVGCCGTSHLDTVLVKLEQVAKDDKKSGGLFSFIKDFKGDPDHGKLKATIILCYGYVAKNGTMPILSTRVETPILRNVISFYQSSKELIVKQCMLETLKMIAEAVHPENMKESFAFHSKNELLSLMKNILKTESAFPLSNNVRTLTLNATSSLIALDPVLENEEKANLIQIAVSSVYSLPKDLFLQKSKDDENEMNLDYDQLLFSSIDALNLLLQQFLAKDRTFKNLESVFQILYTWMMSKHDVERERCLHSVLYLLHFYFKATENDLFTPFITFGSILGMLIPRCTDPQVTVRHLAFDSIDILFKIAIRSQATSNDYDQHIALPLHTLKEQIISDNASSLFTVTKELGKLVSTKLSVEQICPFLLSLIDGLCDTHSQSSSGASVVMNSVIKSRGRELHQEIFIVFENLRAKLELIQCPHTRKGALKCIQNIAHHHLTAVLSPLLQSPLPLDNHSVDIWKVFAQDEGLARLVLDYCLNILSGNNVLVSPPDPHSRNSNTVAASKPLIVICAFRELFKTTEMEKLSKEQFDKLFSTLVLVIGAYIDASPPTLLTEGSKTSSISFTKKVEHSSSICPIRFAVDALRNFLMCVKEDSLASSLTEGGYWALMEDSEKFPEAIGALGRSLCTCCPFYIPKIVAFLNPMLNSQLETQRIVVIALFAEFLSQSYMGRSSLAEPLMNNLMGRLIDSSHIVRKLCMRGLGGISMFEKDQVQRYSTSVLSAMMAGMDEKEDPGCDISLEAMNGLSSLLSKVAEEDVRGVLINIALRVKPMFEKDKASVRTAAFTLFGRLAQFCNGPSQEPLLEQIHNNLVPLLLHLNDSDKHVIKACKNTLKLIGPLIESKDVNSMFQKHMLDDGHLHYPEFINDLTKAMVIDFSSKINFYATTCLTYLKSTSPAIQCNAAIFLGYLLGNIPVDLRENIPKERICSALVVLLKDQKPDVKIRAADALSLLYDY